MHNRRNFIKKIGAFLAFSSFSMVSIGRESTLSQPQKKRILPKKLTEGSLIGLIAPGGDVSEKQLKEAQQNLENLGFKTYFTQNILAKEGYLAGSDEQRASDIMHMFTNPKVDAIFCVRGGYGTARTLNLLNYEQIKQNPKILIGYSDITALITALYQRIGLVSFHGPVATSTFNSFSIESMKNVIQTPQNEYIYDYLREKDTEQSSEYDVYTISGGKASGKLIGGNLMMLVSLVGTKYEPDFEDKIIFIEEVREKPYKVDRMLTQLLMATNFSKAAGIVCGIFNKCDAENLDESFSLKEVLTRRLQPLNIPIFYGAPFGHVENKWCLPVGINAFLDADNKTLKLLESAVY